MAAGFRFQSYGTQGFLAACLAVVLMLPVLFSSCGSKDKTRGSISGTLLTEDGQPVPGGRVDLYRHVLGEWVPLHEFVREPLATATTDRNGDYTFGSLANGGYQMFARAKGRRPTLSVSVAVNDGNAVKDVDFRMLPSLPVRILTVDEQNNPVPRVPVFANINHGGLDNYSFGHDYETDDSGELIYDMDPLSYLQLRAMPEDYAWTPLSYVDITQVCVLTLEKGRNIRGQVLDGEGQPVAGADVYAQAVVLTRASQVHTNADRVVRSDQSGGFELNNLREGNYYVLARKEHLLQAESGCIGLFKQDVEGLTLRAEPMKTVRGRVTGADEEPAAGVLLTMVPEQGMTLRKPRVLHFTDTRCGGMVPIDTAVTDENGEYEMLPSGEEQYNLTIRQPVNAYWFNKSSQTFGDDGTVQEISLDYSDYFYRILPTRTRSGFLWQVLAWFGIYRPAPAVLAAAPDIPVIQGRVVPLEGQPRKKTRVTLNFGTPVAQPWMADGLHCVTDQEGRYRFEMPLHFASEAWNSGSPMDFTFRLSAQDTGYCQGETTYTMPSTATVFETEIHLEEGATISGVVRDPDGKPVNEAWVWGIIAGPETGYAIAPAPEDGGVFALSDEEGRYRLRNLDPGRHYHVGASTRIWGLATAKDIPVPREDVDLTLTRMAVIQGTVTYPDGRPAPNAFINCGERGTDQVFNLFLEKMTNPMALSGPDGGFRLNGISVNGNSPCTVAARLREHSTEAVKVNVAPGQVSSSVAVHMRGLTPVSGTVTDKETGAPLPRARIHREIDNHQVIAAETDDQGNFDLGYLKPDELRLYVRCDGYVGQGRWLDNPAVYELMDGYKKIDKINFALEKSGYGEGVVLDGRDRPMEDVMVTVLIDNLVPMELKSRNRSFWDPDNGGRTGRDGRFSVTGAHPGAEVKLLLEGPDNRKYEKTLTITAERQPEPQKFKLNTMASVSGYVLNASEVLIEGGVVSLSGGSRIQQATPTNGYFSFTELDAGKYELNYRPQDGDDHGSTSVTLGEGQSRSDVRIVVTPAYMFNRSSPREEWRVRARGILDLSELDLKKDGEDKPLAQVRNALRDFGCLIYNATGEFAVSAITLDDATMDIVVDVYGSYPTVYIPEVRLPTDQMVIRCPKVTPGKIEGDVVDAETGELIENAFVRLEMPWSNRDTSWGPVRKGRYGHGRLGDSTVRVQARAKGYAPSEILTVETRANTTVTAEPIRLRKGIPVQGTVRNENGFPIPGASVQFGDATYDGVYMDWGKTRAEGGGVFTISDLGPGTYFATVTIKGHTDLIKQEVRVLENEPNQFTFRLKLAGELNVSVMDGCHSTIEDATVLCDGVRVPFYKEYGKQESYKLVDLSPGQKTITLLPCVAGAEVQTQTAEIKRGEKTGVRFRVTEAGVDPCAPVVVDDFLELNMDRVPSWRSRDEGIWGMAGRWMSMEGGQQGRFLESSLAGTGASQRTLLFQVPLGVNVEISTWMKAPPSPDHYWMEFAYRFGRGYAQAFDLSPEDWTVIQKFDSRVGENGNNNTWTRYSRVVNTGPFNELSVGFKIGALTGSCPPVGWDAFEIRVIEKSEGQAFGQE